MNQAIVSRLSRLCQGPGAETVVGYEITSADVWAACSHTLHAARNAGQGEQVRARIRRLVDAQRTNDMVVETIERCLRHEPD